MNQFLLVATISFLLLWQTNTLRAQRSQLEVGQALPELSMPSLTDDGTLRLEKMDGQLAFTNSAGEVTKPRAVVVFFVRY